MLISCVMFLDRRNHNLETASKFFPHEITGQTVSLLTVWSKRGQLEQVPQDPWGTPSDCPPSEACVSHHSPLSPGCGQGTNLHTLLQILFLGPYTTLDSGLCSNFFQVTVGSSKILSICYSSASCKFVGFFPHNFYTCI